MPSVCAVCSGYAGRPEPSGKGRGGGELRMKIVYEKDDSLSNKNQPGLIIIINVIYKADLKPRVYQGA